MIGVGVDGVGGGIVGNGAYCDDCGCSGGCGFSGVGGSDGCCMGGNMLWYS